MHTKTTISFSESSPITDNNVTKESPTQNLTTQVKAVKQKIIRRKFSTADKLKILETFDACENVLARNAFLRKEGLYYASIVKWRKQLSEKKSNHDNSKSYKLTLENNKVIRENVALKKKLAQAEAIIDLQKKVSELLSTHVLNQKTSEE